MNLEYIVPITLCVDVLAQAFEYAFTKTFHGETVYALNVRDAPIGQSIVTIWSGEALCKFGIARLIFGNYEVSCDEVNHFIK